MVALLLNEYPKNDQTDESSALLIDEAESHWYNNELWPRFRTNVGDFGPLGRVRRSSSDRSVSIKD